MRRLAMIFVLVLLPVLAAADDKQEKAISPEEAAKQVDKQCLVEMQVKSVGKSGDRYFLNSQSNFRDEKNFTIFIDSAVFAKFKEAKIADPREHYKDKIIRVKGKIILYNNRPEIKVDGPDQIEIVEKKKEQ